MIIINDQKLKFHHQFLALRETITIQDVMSHQDMVMIEMIERHKLKQVIMGEIREELLLQEIEEMIGKAKAMRGVTMTNHQQTLSVNNIHLAVHRDTQLAMLEIGVTEEDQDH